MNTTMKICQNIWPSTWSKVRINHGSVWKVLSQGSCMQNMNALLSILQKIWSTIKILWQTDRQMSFNVPRLLGSEGDNKQTKVMRVRNWYCQSCNAKQNKRVIAQTLMLQCKSCHNLVIINRARTTSTLLTIQTNIWYAVTMTLGQYPRYFMTLVKVNEINISSACFGASLCAWFERCIVNCSSRVINTHS